MVRRILGLGAAALFVLSLVSVASATNIPPGKEIDFSSGKLVGGTVDYTPAPGNALSITNAPIAFVQQFPSFLEFPLVGGFLDMVTGGCVSGCSFNVKSKTTSSFFADGGLIQIFGSIPSLPGDPSGLLFQGVWNHLEGSHLLGHKNCQLTNATLNAKTGKGGVGGCVEVDFLNPVMMADLGFKNTSGKGFMSSMLISLTNVNGRWVGTVGSLDMLVLPTPEPASLALLGTGLLFVGTVVRKKINARPNHKEDILG